MKDRTLLPLILVTAFLDILWFSLFIPVMPTITAHFMQAESWTMWAQSIYSLGMFLAWAYVWSLSDTYGRKNMLLFTTIVNIIWYITMYFALHTGYNIATFGFWLYLFSRLISGIGGAGFGVVQAYISDISTKETRAKNMGLMGAAFGTAFLVGPAMGWVLAKFFGIEWIILLAIGLITLNLIWIYFKLEEPKKHVREMTDDIDKDFSFTPKILFLLALSLFATIGFSVIQSGSTQYTADRFGFSSDMIGYSLAVVGITAILYQGFLVKYVRRVLSEVGMLVSGLGVIFIGMALYVINPFWIGVFFISILFPLGMGTFNPALASQLSQASPQHSGRVMGMNTSTTGIGGIIGPLLVGILYAAHITLPFWWSAWLFFVLFCVAWYYFSGEKKMVS